MIVFTNARVFVVATIGYGIHCNRLEGAHS